MNFARGRQEISAATWMCESFAAARSCICRYSIPARCFSAGDAHAAQGDGEVCINGIECPTEVTLRFQVHKRRPLAGPLIESGAGRDASALGEAWIVVESATDAVTAARVATSRMIDLLVAGGISTTSTPTCCAAWPCTCGSARW